MLESSEDGSAAGADRRSTPVIGEPLGGWNGFLFTLDSAAPARYAGVLSPVIERLAPSSMSSAHPAAAERAAWLRATAMPEPIR